MKLLIDPVYTSTEISKCSSYKTMKDYGLRFLQTFDNAYVYCTVPDESSGYYKNDDLVNDSRWVNIPMPFAKSRYRNVFLPHDKYLDNFGMWGKYWDFDIVYTSRSNGWWWRCLAYAGTSPAICRFFILNNPFPLMTFKDTFVMQPKFLCDVRELVSYLFYDKVFVKGEFERVAIVDYAKSLLSPALAMKIMEKVETKFEVNVGFEYVNSVEAESNFVSSPFIVTYVQRINTSQKRFEEVYNVLWYMFAGLKDQNVMFHVFTNSYGDLPSKDSKFMTLARPPRVEFYELLKKTHVCVVWSKEEGMPNAVFEAMSFGNIAVVKRERWSEDFFGADYPWLVNDKTEAIVAIKDINENRVVAWDKFRDWYLSSFQKRMASRLGHYDYQDKLIKKHIEDMLSVVKSRGEYGLAEIINASSFDKVDLMDLPKIDGVRTLKPPRNVDETLFSRMMSRYKAKFILNYYFGWQDTSESGVLVR